MINRVLLVPWTSKSGICFRLLTDLSISNLFPKKVANSIICTLPLCFFSWLRLLFNCRKAAFILDSSTKKFLEATRENLNKETHFVYRVYDNPHTWRVPTTCCETGRNQWHTGTSIEKYRVVIMKWTCESWIKLWVTQTAWKHHVFTGAVFCGQCCMK